MTVAPLAITKDTTEIAFQVSTAKETPVGIHKTLFCQAAITQAGEPIVATIGTTELQVTAPPASAPPVAATTPSPKATAEPAAKPLSRLEQLRAQVKGAKGGTP